MKAKRLVFAAIAAMVALAGCDEQEPTKEPAISLDPASVEFEQKAETKTITVNSTRDWSVTDIPEWLALSATSGKASGNAKVDVTVKENTGADREAKIVFSIGLMNKTLTVTQKGTGSADEAILYFNNFDKAKSEREGSYYPNIEDTDNWKNAIGAGAANVTYAYQTKGISIRSNSPSVGDHSLYKGSGVNNVFFGKGTDFEIQKIALNGTKDLRLSFGAEKYLLSSEDVYVTPEEFKVYVSADGVKYVALTYTFASGSAPKGFWDLLSSVFSVAEGTTELYIRFNVSVASAFRLDDVKLEISGTAGTAVDFTAGTELPAITTGGGTGGDTGEFGPASGDGTQANPYNAAGAHAVAAALAADKPTESEVYVKGKVVEVKTSDFQAQYGNITCWISDEGYTGRFYMYRFNNFGGEKFASVDAISIGDEIVVRAKLTNYKGDTPETASGGTLISLNGKTEGEGGGSGGDEPAPPVVADPIGSVSAPATVAEALAAIEKMEETATAEIVVSGVVTGNPSISTQYGNANYSIKDAEGTATLYVFRGFALGEDVHFEADGLKAGDKVTIKGTVGFYQSSPQIQEGSYLLAYEAGEVVEVKGITLTFPGETDEDNAVNGYTAKWTATCAGYEYAINGFNNYKLGWDHIRCGRKDDPSVATISTKAAAMPKVSKVIVTILKNGTPSALKSFTLSVCSDAECKNIVGEPIAPTGGAVVGDNTFEIPTANQAAGQYYLLTFDCAKASNGFIQVSKVVYAE